MDPSSSEVPPPRAEDGKCAIDDSADEDEESAQMMRRLSADQYRTKHDKKKGIRVQEILPFHFSPIFLPLTESHLESTLALENAAFTNPSHRCSRDKLAYRLAHCSDISFGLFCTVKPSEAKAFGLETVDAANLVETNREDGAVHALFAHAVSTLGKGPVVTDADMDYPKNWHDHGAVKDTTVGHQEEGRTICLHSFAVSPKLQGTGVGKLAMRSYIQIMNESGVADRIALLCQDYLIPFYRKFGFQNLGESKATFGGGGWYDMVLDLGGPPHPERDHPQAHLRHWSMVGKRPSESQ
ncbi:polyamine acetyltransferase [Plectosphaerella plurivora]|uniref:Polyamine acetyltransferase n=1 Tax=Plectosphaerella plurivora TaxID=936078 RepID=A0A9P9ACB0_9PEZI|nr:polyamine acetyltransferase [Plectosphaerella plurivora]